MYAGKVHIFLVEDSPSDVWLIREALRLAQVPVLLTIAQDGAEANKYLRELETASGDCPHLILLDLNLPRRNGREVLADIKGSRRLREIPVVVLSSSQADEDRRQAYLLQADGFFTKPSSLPAYVEMVRGLDRFWLGGFELRRTA
jgi:two-component system response regulator